MNSVLNVELSNGCRKFNDEENICINLTHSYAIDVY